MSIHSEICSENSIAKILTTIAEEGDIHKSVYKKYIWAHRVKKEHVGENINLNEEDDVEDGPHGAAEVPQKGTPVVRTGGFLQIHEDYFLWTQQTRITNNKNLQSHAHSAERQAQRKLEIERTACRRARDAIEREQSRLLGREAQIGNQLWCHVRQEGEHRRAFDHCVTKSLLYKKAVADAVDMVLVSVPVRLRVSGSSSWHRGIVSLKDGAIAWESAELPRTLCGEMRLAALQRLMAYPPHTAVASSGIFFGSCKIESSMAQGRCFGREVVLLEWLEGVKVELAPVYEMSTHSNESSEGATPSARSTSVSSSGTASVINDDGLPVWNCQVCSHANNDMFATKCASCMSAVPPPPPASSAPSPPPPPPPIGSRNRRPSGGSIRSDKIDPDQLSESFEILVATIDLILATRLEQPLPLLGSLLNQTPSLLTLKLSAAEPSSSKVGARRRAASSREAVTVQLSLEGRTSSEASSLPSSISAKSSSSATNTSPNNFDAIVNDGPSQKFSLQNAPKSLLVIVEESLMTTAAKLGVVDTARHQLQCAHRERSEAQASILRAVSRRERSLELLGSLKQLQDMCRRPPLEGRNGKWTSLPERRTVVLSEVGRRLSQALDTSIPDLWASSSETTSAPTSPSSSVMTSWPPIQNMHDQSMPSTPEATTPRSSLTSEHGVKGVGSLSSAEVLRLKKRSAAEKRRSSHVRFLRNGVDDFAVDHSKLRVCSLIYEFQNEGTGSDNRSQREPPELAKEYDRLRGLVRALWEKQNRFMRAAHALSRERALLIWYIQAGYMLTGADSGGGGGYSFASGSAADEGGLNVDLVSASTSLDMSCFYTPNASLCEDLSPLYCRSLSQHRTDTTVESDVCVSLEGKFQASSADQLGHGVASLSQSFEANSLKKPDEHPMTDNAQDELFDVEL